MSGAHNRHACFGRLHHGDAGISHSGTSTGHGSRRVLFGRVLIVCTQSMSIGNTFVFVNAEVVLDADDVPASLPPVVPPPPPRRLVGFSFAGSKLSMAPATGFTLVTAFLRNRHLALASSPIVPSRPYTRFLRNGFATGDCIRAGAPLPPPSFWKTVDASSSTLSRQR